MSSENSQLSADLKDLAIAMEIRGESWRSASYLKASEEIFNLNENILKLYRSGRLQEINGIGSSIESKIKEFFEEGKINALEETRGILPEDMSFFRGLPLSLRETADICIFADVHSAGDLLQALDEGVISGMPTLGPDVEKKIIEHIAWLGEQSAEIPYSMVASSCQKVLDFIIRDEWTEAAVATGAFRQKEGSAATFTILIASQAGRAVPLFAACPEIKELTHVNSTSATGKTESGAAAMLKSMRKEDIPFMQMRMTGPPSHIEELEEKARSLGLKLSPESMPGIQSEQDIYALLNMDYIMPEFRGGGAPGLRIKGDLRVRSISADGVSRIESVLAYAENLGYEYVCFTDRLGASMSPEDMRRRNEQIDKASGSVDILKGIEVSIGADGSLEAPEDLISEADLVIASVLSFLDCGPDMMTSRIEKALLDRRTDVWGHPLNNIFGIRTIISADFGKLFSTAAETGTAVEINASPYRSDFSVIDTCKVYEPAAVYSIGTDSALPRHLCRMDLGRTAAERAGLLQRRVLNTFTSSEIRDKAWRQ